jgi:hypothetical protein
MIIVIPAAARNASRTGKETNSNRKPKNKSKTAAVAMIKKFQLLLTKAIVVRDWLTDTQ